jgi:Ca2+-binding EF-hand superfamily protein
MGYDSSPETADSILREVDFNRDGAIEFHEFLDVSFLAQPIRSALPSLPNRQS